MILLSLFHFHLHLILDPELRLSPPSIIYVCYII